MVGFRLMSSGWSLPGSSYRWNLANILLLLLMVPVADAQPKCHSIETLVVTNEENPCEIDPVAAEKVLGNPLDKSLVDFSKAQPAILKKFLENFEHFHGAMLMDGNQDVQSLDLGKLLDWDSKKLKAGDRVIQISNNPKLKEVLLMNGIDMRKSQAVSDVYVLVYNNPLLSNISLANIRHATGIDKFIPIIQDSSGVCKFSDPLNLDNYIPPSEGLLAKCKKVDGDLYVEEGKIIKGDIELTMGCLHLLNGKMTSKFIINKDAHGRGSETCANGNKSMVKNVDGLCGKDLEAIENYFPPKSNVLIEPHANCGKKECKSADDLKQKYSGCQSIDDKTYNINNWFSIRNLVRYPKMLKIAKGTLTIIKTSFESVSLPEMTSIKHLKIVDNPDLININLPKLTSIEELTITNCPKFFFAKLKSIRPKKSLVECYLNGTAVSDITDLGICTVIKSDKERTPVVFDGVQEDFDKMFMKDKTIESCVIIRNTNLTNVDFLKEMKKIQCNGTIILENNPQLCLLEKIGNLEVTMKGAYRTKKCHKKICKSITEGDCDVIDGDLILDSDTKMKDLANLEEIRGSLIISRTYLEFLELPLLENITGPKAPVISILRNWYLTDVKAPKLKTVATTGSGKPLVRIALNLKMHHVGFLPREIQLKCADIDDDSVCQYGIASIADSSSLYIFMLVWVGFFICLTGVMALSGYHLWYDTDDDGHWIYVDDKYKEDLNAMREEEAKNKEMELKKMENSGSTDTKKATPNGNKTPTATKEPAVSKPTAKETASKMRKFLSLGLRQRDNPPKK